MPLRDKSLHGRRKQRIGRSRQADVGDRNLVGRQPIQSACDGDGIAARGGASEDIGGAQTGARQIALEIAVAANQQGGDGRTVDGRR